jgi:hypothetical protein
MRSGCWNGWIRPFEQQTVETPVGELDAMLVMLDDGVHGKLLCGEIPGA